MRLPDVLVDKFGRFPSVMQHRRAFFSAAVKLVVAKVNKVCYYGFARYILAISDTSISAGVWFCVSFFNRKHSIQLEKLEVNNCC